MYHGSYRLIKYNFHLAKCNPFYSKWYTCYVSERVFFKSQQHLLFHQIGVCLILVLVFYILIDLLFSPSCSKLHLANLLKLQCSLGFFKRSILKKNRIRGGNRAYCHSLCFKEFCLLCCFLQKALMFLGPNLPFFNIYIQKNGRLSFHILNTCRI